jgi:SAM-dependent methyltransferase
MSARPWYEERFDAAYLEAYAHRDAAEAERATRHLLEPIGLCGRLVLDLACGAGRYAATMRARGARVVGLDLSAALLAAAAASGAWRVRGDMRRLPFGDRTFDVAISMFTSFGYFATADEDRGVLAEVARVLVPGGTFVLDTLNATALGATLGAETRRHAAGWSIVERRRLDGECIVKEIEMQRGGERRTGTERVRLWTREDLESAFAAFGLAVTAVFGDYDAGAFAAATSPRLVLRAERTA